jgi:hypothetical protein
MFVDPRFKLAYLENVVQRNEVQKYLLGFIYHIYPSSIPCISMPSQGKKRPKYVTLHEFLLSIGTTKGPNKTLEQEVAWWFSTPTVILNDDDSVFAWWATNHTHFRRIALAAKDFLAIPGGSVPSERASSTAGRLVTPFCTSLSHDSIQAHVCLSSWLENDNVAIDDVNEDTEATDSCYDIVDEHGDDDV